VEAVKWYRKAAEQNFAAAQYALSLCYATGAGLAKDQAEGLNWCRKATEQNYAAAQYWLGYCYANGFGVAKDQVEGVKWYRKATEQNDAQAQHALGACYANSEGVAKDQAEAAKWYRKATEQNFAEAQYNLGGGAQAPSLAQKTSDYAETKGPGAVFWICNFAVIILVIASNWKVFSKAGQPGWAAIIPIYNVYVMCKVAGRPGWWLLLLLIPLANFIIAIILIFILNVDVAKRFGKGVGFAIGMIFLPFIFWPILGFGRAQYQGGAPSIPTT